MIVATFKAEEAQPVAEVTNRFRTRDWATELKLGTGTPASAAKLTTYLKPTDLMPTDGIILETVAQIVGSASSDDDKARRVYDWVIENTERNRKTRGCGVGDIRSMLENNALNGKCADLSALFVASLRSVGVLAQDVYGIRVADSLRGYKSLGRAGDITPAQHCRVEFYAQGIGWVPVDPADVRKVVLEERPKLTLNEPLVRHRRGRYSGAAGKTTGCRTARRTTCVCPAPVAPVAFLMYPQAENEQGRLDRLDRDSFKYRVTVRKLS